MADDFTGEIDLKEPELLQAPNEHRFKFHKKSYQPFQL
jgi:hypothetical protein